MSIKNKFPIFTQEINGHALCYLDSASTSQKPEMVIDTVSEFYKKYNANIYRGTHSFGEQATRLYEQARETVADYIGCEKDEVIFTKGTTAGINAIATVLSYNLKAGDEIVLTQLEHHSNLVPWQQVCKRIGTKLKFIPVDKDGILDYSHLDTIITAKTKVVSFLNSSNAIGTTIDPKPILAAAKKVRAWTLIDAAQSVPHNYLRIRELGCDFTVFSGHKMLAPTGVGVLFIKKEIQEQIAPYQFGGGMIYEATWNDASFLPAPQKYEAGTPPIAQAVGLAAAIKFLQEEIELPKLIPYEASLTKYLIEELSDIDRIQMVGPLEQLKKEGHLLSFTVDGIHPHDVAAYLDQYGICVRAGNHCAQPLGSILGLDSTVRVSFYLYNDEEDVARLIDALKKLVKTS